MRGACQVVVDSPSKLFFTYLIAKTASRSRSSSRDSRYNNISTSACLETL